MHPARLHLEALHAGVATAEPDFSAATLDSPRKSGASSRICVAATRSILVIDDNDRHLDILDSVLSSVGHDVQTCGSGLEALRRVEQDCFDVVVLDLIMPDVSGAFVAEAMRTGVLNVRTPIIACTANVTLARRQLAGVAGVSAIIGKPIDTASLVLAVARAPRCERRMEQVRH
jgi:CheY-like chemotaxis protein